MSLLGTKRTFQDICYEVRYRVECVAKLPLRQLKPLPVARGPERSRVAIQPSNLVVQFDVRPNWKEPPPAESLTGKQWR